MPSEDSPEVNLFKLLMRDLDIGNVIRQERDINQLGQFLKKRTSNLKLSLSAVLKSAFDNIEASVLTELGKQFVHYKMNEAVIHISASETSFKQSGKCSISCLMKNHKSG